MCRQTGAADSAYSSLHRPQQPDIAVLNEIHSGNPVARVVLGNADHQTQIRLDEPAPGPVTASGEPLQLPARIRFRATPAESFGREQSDSSVGDA